MIAEERGPLLPSWARRAYVPHVFLNRAFAHANTQLEQLASDAPNPVLATWHIRSQKRQFSPSHFAGAIRLFPPSYQGLAACRKGMVVQITTTFPSVPQVQSAFCPGVTGLHLLYCCVSVRRCSAVMVPQLAPSIPEPRSKHDQRPYHDRWYR
jgi:hypothetical protein